MLSIFITTGFIGFRPDTTDRFGSHANTMANYRGQVFALFVVGHALYFLEFFSAFNYVPEKALARGQDFRQTL